MVMFNKDDMKDFAPPANGDYKFTVIEAANGFTKEKGHPCIILNLQLEEDANNIKVKVWLVFTPAGLNTVKEFCYCVGLQKQWEDGNLDAEDCLGVDGLGSFRLGLAKLDGKQYFELKKFLAKGSFSESPKTQPQRPANTGTAPKSNFLDADIPF